MLWDRLLVSCRQQYIKFRFPAVSECGVTPGWHGRGGLEDASSRSKTTCVVQRDANEWREAAGILRSGNAPKRSGGEIRRSRTRRALLKTGRYRPPVDRNVYITHLWRDQYPAQAEADAKLPAPLKAAYDGLEVVF